MAGTYTPGKGMTLMRGAVVVPQVRSITLPRRTNARRDNTHLASTAVESAPTLPDNGTISVEILWNPANTVHQAIETDFAAGTISEHTVTLADAGAATYIGQMFYEDLSPAGLDVRGSLIMAATLRYQETLAITP